MKICAVLLSVLVTLAGCPAWAEGDLVTGPDRRHELDLRIEKLDAERAEISMKGPQTASLLGLGMLVGGGVALAVGLTGCGINSNECKPEGAAYGAGIGLLAAGAVTTMAGVIVWSKRANRRDAIDAERNELIEERDGLAPALSRLEVSSAYRNGAHFVALGVRF